jgi:hypothetical protein
MGRSGRSAVATPRRPPVEDPATTMCWGSRAAVASTDDRLATPDGLACYCRPSPLADHQGWDTGRVRT